MYSEDTIDIINKTKGRLPSLPFELLKKDILGKEYSLSVAFVGEKESQKINYLYREKNNPTNVLSFSLSKNNGELVLCPKKIKSETEKFGKTYSELLLFLVIHGMLHLKGMQHSARMEAEEKKYYEKYFHWNRSGLSQDQSTGGRNIKRRKKS
ncbi:MAG: rRNA maturation RNase YbeY [Candidatus Pacebacteria bacterium]|nr:rRNA maturation RNase YbeY [Candidatus Paceibacterota bacterium]MCF7863026.1 rRNA maturation RNase YbeY [Candidatus Paceibacterota bacterium]